MPKMKTKKNARKRLRITAKGKVKYFRAGKSHLLTGKRAKRKRFLSRSDYLAAGEAKIAHKLLPYGA